MKRCIIFYSLLILIVSNVFAQTNCQKIKIITNSVEQEVIETYIKECKAKGLLKENKGLIILTIHKPDKENVKKIWHVIPTMYNNSLFANESPLLYTETGSDLIIIQSKIKLNNFDRLTPKENDCITRLLEHRVIPLPIPQPIKYDTTVTQNGKLIIGPLRKGRLGGSDGEYFIRFYKNGKYTRTRAA